ncbi:MAG: (2Fe-2S)-binding protein [Chloroflexota bacterium]|nr:aromatic ring-hydroxylating dioxygenase subunit alpha [Caldilinea sp.]GIK75115.1 MAG: (2Fe-2S)-binding protein [Chloroflexota bacterium]
MMGTATKTSDSAMHMHLRRPSEDAIQSYYTAMRRFWHPVLAADELPNDTPIGVELLEERLVLTRLNGAVVAMQDLCRHFQAQLSLGEVRTVAGHGQCLMCPYHGWSYSADGRCVEIPQLAADRQIPADAVVPSYLAAERYGLIWVCLDDNPLFELPIFPHVNEPDFLAGPLRKYPTWKASTPRAIMAALDDTHGPWVHEGLVGDRNHPESPEHKVRRDGRNLVINIRMVQPDNPTISENGDPTAKIVNLTTTVGIPNTIHFTIRAEGSERITLIWQAVCPIRYNESLTFWGSSRNYDLDKPAYNDKFERMQDTLREQDRVIVESQRPWLLPPFWTKIELPLRPADLPLIEYQRWLEELGISTML